MVYAVNRVLGATCMVYCSRTLRLSSADLRVSAAVVTHGNHGNNELRWPIEGMERVAMHPFSHECSGRLGS